MNVTDMLVIQTQTEALGMELINNVTNYGNRSSPAVDPFHDPSDDAVWILTSTFIIFTMQSGFGLLESGSVTTKNEVNIMVKNAVDVIVGGTTYWMFGYAFSFGRSSWSNPFCGWGFFFVDVDEEHIGEVYSQFFFQASFATTATTIVSGAMAERTKLESYIVFSAFNTLVFCFPAHWVWAPNGWLKTMGFIDVAGDGPVHLVGGVTGLVSTLMLKPRHGRFDRKLPPPMGSPTNALLGMFMLWWGWLGFNCGSTFGISGPKWKLAARSAVATLSASAAGGTVSLLLSYIMKKRKFDVGYIINGILGSLVAITGICALAKPWEGVVIGVIGAILVLGSIELLDRLKVDDPVGCVGVHAIGGAWGMLAVGLFTRPDDLRLALQIDNNEHGVFMSGEWYLFGIQVLGVVTITGWTVVSSYTILKLIDLTLGLRMPLHHEILGADLVEHAIGDITYCKARDKILGLEDQDNLSSSDLEKRIREFNESRNDRHRSIFSRTVCRTDYTPGIESHEEELEAKTCLFCSRLCSRCRSEDTGSPSSISGRYTQTPNQVYGSTSSNPWRYNGNINPENRPMSQSPLEKRHSPSKQLAYFRRAKSLDQRFKSSGPVTRRHTFSLSDIKRRRNLTEKQSTSGIYNRHFRPKNNRALKNDNVLRENDIFMNGEVQVISSGVLSAGSEEDWDTIHDENTGSAYV